MKLEVRENEPPYPWFSTTDPEAKTLADAVFRRLRADILTGKLPAGSKLPIDELRATYGVGGSSIREALVRLTAARLVVAEGQRGFWVAEVSAADLMDLTKNKIWVETTALRLSIANGDRNWEASVLAAGHRLGPNQPWRDPKSPRDIDDSWYPCHRAFHAALVSACDSEQLMSQRAMLHGLGDRYARAAGLKGRPGLTSEHKDLMEAALDRDPDGAAACIESHFLLTMEMALVDIPNLEADAATLIERLRIQIRAGINGRSVTMENAGEQPGLKLAQDRSAGTE